MKILKTDEDTYLDKWHTPLQHAQAFLDSAIEPSVISAWSERHEIFLVLDVLLFSWSHRLFVEEIVIHTLDFS
jgi:hypothetical protein